MKYLPFLGDKICDGYYSVVENISHDHLVQYCEAFSSFFTDINEVETLAIDIG